MFVCLEGTFNVNLNYLFFNLVFSYNIDGKIVGRISWAFFSGNRTVEPVQKHVRMRNYLIYS